MTDEVQCTPDPGLVNGPTMPGASRTPPVLIAQPSWMGYPNFPCVNSPAIMDGLSELPLCQEPSHHGWAIQTSPVLTAQPSWMGLK